MTRPPHFLGIGAQKAGTSWIHACLFEHPQVFMPGNKELHFFSRHYGRGAEWYAAQFAACPPGCVSGEISPSYLYDPEAPARIQAWNPAVKLLVVLRNPVERAVSAYRYAVQTGAMPASRSFEEALALKPSYVAHGLYAAQLRRYLGRFDAGQILVTLQEDVAADPFAFLERIHRFLGVDPGFRPRLAQRRVNASTGAPRFRWADRWAAQAAEGLRRRGLDRLVWAVARSPVTERLRGLNRRLVPAPSISAALRRRLERELAPDAREVARYLGRDLRRLWFDYEQAGAPAAEGPAALVEA